MCACSLKKQKSYETGNMALNYCAKAIVIYAFIIITKIGFAKKYLLFLIIEVHFIFC